MVVRHTLGGGRAKGIVCAWAHSIGIGFYALLTLLGLAAMLKHTPLIFNAIALLGAIYLAWMGIQALRSKGGMSDKLAAGENTGYLKAAQDGIAISIFNPKIILFFLALFSQFVAVADDILGNTLVVVTPLIVDGLWYSIIAMILSHKSVLPKLRAKAAIIDKLSGIVLIGLASRVIFTL
jgi:threonine/homoserine/homoserine lactone efflux protein